MGLLLLLAVSSLVFTGVAGMSLFGPQTFTADDKGKSVTVNTGETFWLKLPENPAAGYAWDLKLSDGLIKLSDKYEPADRSGLKVEVGGTHSYEIKALKNGSQMIAGSYRRADNQTSPEIETYTLGVNVADGGLLSGILRLSFPVMASGGSGLSDPSGSAVKKLVKPGDSNIMSILSPTAGDGAFPIIQTGTSISPLPAARNQRTPQDIRLSYTDVPPIDTINANVGDTIRLSLPENPSTGYSWQMMMMSDGIEQVSDNYVPGNRGTPQRPLVGAGGTHEWAFKVAKSGLQTISGIYKRPWEGSSVGEKTYKLNVNAA